MRPEEKIFKGMKKWLRNSFKKMFIIPRNYRNVDQTNFEILSDPSQNSKDQQNTGQQMLEEVWGKANFDLPLVEL